jgi:glycosyltransferase involved in cell wall biosynthesis
MELTIITPYVAAHAELLERAKASVLAQTMPCEFIAVYDEQRQGVAWARNAGVKLATTPLVAFLDADDYLMPDYAERMVARWESNSYTYCDFYFGDQAEPRPTKDCIQAQYERRHTVTCVISVADFWRVGGFDSTFKKAEDVEFWFRCHAKGVRGRRVPHLLMHYTSDRPVKRHEDTHLVGHYLDKIYNQYPGVQTMGCCDDSIDMRGVIVGNKKEETDVLVMMNWAGNRSHMGSITGRLYPRNGNGKRGWIDPRDQAAHPELYSLVPPVAPSVEEIAPDNFQIETESAVPSEEKPKRSRSKKS